MRTFLLAMLFACAATFEDPSLRRLSKDPLRLRRSRPPSVEKTKDIPHLLDITGAAKVGSLVMGQMISMVKAGRSNVPAAFWDELSRELNAESLADLIVPICDRRFTDAEVKEIIAFDESPIGRKLIAESPGHHPGIPEDRTGVDRVASPRSARN